MSHFLNSLKFQHLSYVNTSHDGSFNTENKTVNKNSLLFLFTLRFQFHVFEVISKLALELEAASDFTDI